MKSDYLQRFIFEQASIRGEWVQLTASWQEVLKRREYPIAIQRVLGEMMAAAALLASTVKIDGRLVLQIRSEGPANLLMVECTSQHTLRAFAQWQGDIADDADLMQVTGAGALAITIEMEGAKQPYQGVVSLQEGSLAATIEAYFSQSEQLETKLWLAVSETRAAGLLVQQLPSEDNKQEQAREDWERVCYLSSTVSDNELLNLEAEKLLHRLFHQEQVRLFDPTDLSFACTCSRERVSSTIKMLGQKEAEDILEEQGSIEVSCDFCNQHYHFDTVDVAEIFSGAIAPTESNSKTLH